MLPLCGKSAKSAFVRDIVITCVNKRIQQDFFAHIVKYVKHAIADIFTPAAAPLQPPVACEHQCQSACVNDARPICHAARSGGGQPLAFSKPPNRGVARRRGYWPNDAQATMAVRSRRQHHRVASPTADSILVMRFLTDGLSSRGTSPGASIAQSLCLSMVPASANVPGAANARVLRRRRLHLDVYRAPTRARQPKPSWWRRRKGMLIVTAVALA